MFLKPSFPLQNAAARSAFCAVSELGPRWVPPLLALGVCYCQCTQGFFRPNQPSARSRRRFELGSSYGDHQASSSAQSARGRSARLCASDSGGPEAKTACVAFLSRGALGLLFAARGDFPFAECSCQKLVLRRRCDGASALSGRAGTEGMAAAWAQEAFARPILLSRQGEPVGSGFRAPETPS